MYAGRKLLILGFDVWMEIDVFYVIGQIDLVLCAGQKSHVFSVSIEIDLVFVCEVEIDLISVWRMELDLISVQG